MLYRHLNHSEMADRRKMKDTRGYEKCSENEEFKVNMDMDVTSKGVSNNFVPLLIHDFNNHAKTCEK